MSCFYSTAKLRSEVSVLNSNISNLKIKYADVSWGDITIAANNDYNVYFSTKIL